MQFLTIEEIHEALFMMLIELDGICEREGLRYSLSGGTLLGAVRHKGFIPWDDDVDISMPRPDFDKLVILARSGKLPEGRYMEPYSGNWEYPVFIKYLNSTIAVDEPSEKGVGWLWIDITPVDVLPDDVGEIEHLYSEASKLRRALFFCRSDPSGAKTFIKRSLKRLLVPLSNVAGVRAHAARNLDTLAREKDFDNSLRVGCVVWGLYGTSEAYSAVGWRDMVRLDFGGSLFSAISCWDEYLTGLYGDYMQLPPEDKRVTHGMKAWRVEGAKR